jgi:hypothetical protein
MACDPGELVGRLANLHETDRVATRILTAGPAAIPALVRFLLGGPSLHPGPRRAAAEILGILGGEEAREGLVEGLRLLDREIASPVVRLSEEAVSDAVADALTRFPPVLVVLRRFGTSAEIAVGCVLAECDSIPDSVILRKRQAACRRFLAERP